MKRRIELTATPIPRRPDPPKGISPASRALWRAIVRDYPVGHFTAANRVLLEQFCRAQDLADDCDKVIATEGLFVEGKTHPAIAVRALAWAETRQCATKLRLSISATVRAESAAARPDPTAAMRKPWHG
jgi:P27 family predicted phage terminase small subunit